MPPVLVLLLVGRPRRLLRHPQSSHSTVVPCILGRAVVLPKRPYDCYASTIWLSSLPPNTQGFNEGSRMEWEAWHRPACACVRNTTQGRLGSLLTSPLLGALRARPRQAGINDAATRPRLVASSSSLDKSQAHVAQQTLASNWGGEGEGEGEGE